MKLHGQDMAMLNDPPRVVPQDMNQRHVSMLNCSRVSDVEDTHEERYHRALWELERARANFNEALAAYAREYADGEALTAQAIEREGDD